MTIRLNASSRPLPRARTRRSTRRPTLVVPRTWPRWVEVFVAKFVRYTNYQHYLASWLWRNKRERALKRAEYACQMCNAVARKGVWLEVHHREYPALLGTEPDNDLTVLCNGCHGHHHGEK